MWYELLNVMGGRCAIALKVIKVVYDFRNKKQFKYIKQRLNILPSLESSSSSSCEGFSSQSFERHNFPRIPLWENRHNITIIIIIIII